ncbi:unnamed protein product [Caenorhabditis auriculariae]|uniref:Uncharacterized protein n=1 Tax=Caenorhabditis auriculariae TaxID=2777116 RepID=A0A8S1H3A2_9PELO|nr:unnamed protein product [Caenorhabditis auriculariae]
MDLASSDRNRSRSQARVDEDEEDGWIRPGAAAPPPQQAHSNIGYGLGELALLEQQSDRRGGGRRPSVKIHPADTLSVLVRPWQQAQAPGNKEKKKKTELPTGAQTEELSPSRVGSTQKSQADGKLSPPFELGQLFWPDLILNDTGYRGRGF